MKRRETADPRRCRPLHQRFTRGGDQRPRYRHVL